MFRQTKKFLLASLVCLVALCIAVFVWLGNVMEEKSQKLQMLSIGRNNE